MDDTPALPSAVATPPATGVVAASQNTPLNTPAGPAYPDWLLQTDIGPTFHYDYGVGAPKTTRLFRLHNAFGQVQTGGSWSNAIAFMLIVATQRELWHEFLEENYPNFNRSTDQFPPQAKFSEYCGTNVVPGESLRAQHKGAAHSSGSAIDIEYGRSPYIPMHNGSGLIFDHDSYNISVPHAQALATSCVALWDKICGGQSPSCCKFEIKVSEGLLGQWADEMFAFNAQLIEWFGNHGRASGGDIATFRAATPIGHTIYKPGKGPNDPYNPGNFQSDRSTRDPSKGILGFTKDLAYGVLGAEVSDLCGIAEFADPTVQSTLNKYSFQWAPFIFGPDLQHFDITRTTTIGMTHPPPADVVLAQQAVEKALAARPSAAQANNGPWAVPAT